MKRIALLIVCLWTISAIGQNSKSFIKPDNQNRRRVASQYVREADVMWSKTVWRLIDLKQKFNHHLYYPTTPTGKYLSLSDALFDLVKNQGANIYDENQGDEFGLAMTQGDMNERMGKTKEIIQVEDPVTGEFLIDTIHTNIDTREITRYLLKEIWFFDKARSQMEVRIVGICPVRAFFRGEDATEFDSPVYKKLGWFYFPEIAGLLTAYPAMNGGNEAANWSYYDVFQNRYFNSIIVQIGNTYDNRPISDYATGREALLESERIENDIRNFESDLWSN